MLQHLHEIRNRLWNQDKTLQTVRLWPETCPGISSSYIAMFLEETRIQEALQDCLQACAVSRVVTALYLGNLPEPDMEAALLTLARVSNNMKGGIPMLKRLHIGPLNASSSLSGKVLTKLLQTLAGSPLKVLDCPCRIRVPNRAVMETLAQALSQLPDLRRLRLHIIPRTSIERPTLHVDSLLNVLGELDLLEITVGYPEHNPYQQPIVQKETLSQLIPKNPSLRILTLANLGLTSSHVQSLFRGLWPAKLQHLGLPFNKRLAHQSEWASCLAQEMENPERTTLQSVQVSNRENSMAVDIWTTLNRLGRDELVKATEGSAAHVIAWQDLMVLAQEESKDELLRLNLLLTLIRLQPSLSVQSLSHSML